MMDGRSAVMSPLRKLLPCALALAALLACKRTEPNPTPRPVPPAEHGAVLYGKMCAVCHGAAGEGYKADEATALAHPDFLSAVTDDYLRTAITNGRSGTTMSSWGIGRGGPLAVSDVNDVIAFIRTWDDPVKNPPVKLDEKPAAGDALAAQDVFDKECVKCHGAHGTAGPNVHIGSPEFLTSATNGFLRHAIKKGRVGTPMPAFEATLGDEKIEDLVTLLRSWEKPPETHVFANPPPIPLGPVPLNPKGPEPTGFVADPGTTPADVIKAALDKGAKMAILDARAPSDYTNEHIAGAVSVPFYEPEPYFPKLPKDAWLVCYCSCPHAESGTLARKLSGAGFKKVTVLDEGLGVWKSRKYPTHTGEKP
jgi:cytochrome c oxidase cbb3-type subunit 3/ubiquinol-cytochrome c reductase cytochrome c subunit